LTNFPAPGGCHCGAIRYSLLSPALSVQHCHCSRCRKVYGNLAAQGAVIRRSQIRIEGESNLTTYRSSPSFAGQFCKTCGCHLFSYEDSETELMYLAPATLDGGAHPGHPAGKETHIHVASKAEWEQIGGDLPQYGAASPDEIITGAQRE
jgi:hypothetical protein